MNKSKILSLGIIATIIFALSAIPTGETSPNGISPSINSMVVEQGCSCHDQGADGNKNTDIILNLTMPDNFTAGETYILILNMIL